MNNTNLTGESLFKGIDFDADKVPATYCGDEQLEGIEANNPVDGYYLPLGNEIGLFQPKDATTIFEVMPSDITTSTPSVASSAA